MDPICVICGSRLASWLRVPKIVPDPGSDHYALYRCPECGYGTVWPRPEWEEVAPHYNAETYYTHAPSARGQRRRRPPLVARIAWRADKGQPVTARRILAMLPANSHVCELGCGNGSLVGALRDGGLSVIGVEPDEVARETAAGRGIPTLAGTAEHLPDALALNSFDMIVMSHVLEHCLDPIAAMTNVQKLLKPGGAALITVPNHECIGQAEAAFTWRWMDLPRHVSFFTGQSLRILCQKVGLVVESTNYDGYFRQFNHEWLEEERRIRADLKVKRRPAPWRLLLKTFSAPKQLKYDSVNVTARKMAGDDPEWMTKSKTAMREATDMATPDAG